MDGTKPPKVDDPEIRILSKEEEKLFTAVLPFFNSGNMFALSLATGMRIGEICALDKSDINRTEKYININKTATNNKDKHSGERTLKTGLPKTAHSIRKIPLLPSVEVMLDRQEKFVAELKQRAMIKGSWKENTLVFPTDEGNIHDKSGMRSSMGRILKRAGLPHMTIHALRHTYATTALNTGVSAQNVAKCLGHKDGATTLRFYAHYINAEAIAQLDNLEEKNISHLGITESELQNLNSRSDESAEKLGISERINGVINDAKNFSYKRSIGMVLNECEDILCEPMDNLSSADKEFLLGTLAQYTFLKRNCGEQEEYNEAALNEDEGITLSMM
jgi:site-specific recombinase XerD